MKVTAMFAWVVACGALGACSSSKDISSAEAVVGRFHTAASGQKYQDVLAQCDEGLNKPEVAAKLQALLGAISRKLGQVTSSTQTTWHVNYGTGGETISLQYTTTFEKGSGVEQFLYVVRDGKVQLDGYHINSDELVLN